MQSHQKLGLFLLNKVLRKSSKLIIILLKVVLLIQMLKRKLFSKNLSGFGARKFTLKTENTLFLKVLAQVFLKDIETFLICVLEVKIY